MTTRTVPGVSPAGNSSNSVDWTSGAGRRHLALLLIAGVAATALHAKFNWPLRMPGHHGLEWMALLVFARCASPYRWAALAVAIGAAASTAVPVWGFKDPAFSHVLAYLVQGVTLDLLHRAGMRLRHWVLALALFGALAHAMKPLVYWLLLHTVGGHYGSLTNGLWYPWTSHLMFGFTGAFTGALAWKATQRWRAGDG